MEVCVGGEAEAVCQHVAGQWQGVLLDHVSTHVTRVVLDTHPGLPIYTRVLSHREVVEEKVGLERGECLELDPAYLALVETTEAPGRRSLLRSYACLVKYCYSIFMINTVFIFWLF